MNNKPLKNKNFILFLFANNTSVFGDLLLMTGFSLFVMVITQSAMQFSLTLAIAMVPRVLLSPFAGVIVDRTKKKNLVIMLDVIRGIWLLSLYFISLTGNITITMIYMSLLFFSICDTFFGPAFTTIFPKILDRSQLSEANAINTTIRNIISVLSPLLASYFFMEFGLGIILLVDAITFLVSGISELFLAFEDVMIKSEKHIITDIIEGMKYVRSNIQIKSLVQNGNLTHFFLFPFIEVGVIYILLIVFNAPEMHYGIVKSSISAGAVVAGLLAFYYRTKHTVSKNINSGIWGMLFSVILFSMLTFKGFRDILYVSEYMPVAYLALACFVMFIAFHFYGVFFSSFYQSEVPENMLGRFTSILISTFSVSRILGMLMYGALFEAGLLNIGLIVLFLGMSLKIIVHIPFIKFEKKQITGGSIGIKSSTR